MIKSPKEPDFPLKQEGPSTDHGKAKISSSSTQWLRLKDPRIVRVSRASGGKDRHSKVCTIRGLRDRRIRLSVSTAIQLYDLQDRLGLNQPSKVVDWLLNAAKREIDGLPPLPNIPPGNFTFSYPPPVANYSDATTAQVNEQMFDTNRSINHLEDSSQNSIWKPRSKEASGEMVVDKANWINRSEEDKQGSNEGPPGAHVLPNHPSFFGLLNAMPLGYQWEPSTDGSLGNHGFTNQTDIHGISVVPFPSTLSLSTQSHFPSHVTAMDIDPRQLSNHYQILSSSSQNLVTNSINPSFSLAMMTPKILHSPNNSESPSHKD